MNALRRFKDIHKGEACVIIGNGPSLDVTPLEKFKYITFGSNMIFRKPFFPDYYCIIDEEMMDACLPLPDMNGTTKFLRAEAQEPDNNPIYPIVVNGFSLDIANFIVMGGTVTYALLQIAFYMGFDTFLLVGVDHRYPKSADFERHKFIASGDDPDHFKCADGKPYFEEGKEFNPPELEGTARNYAIANELFQKAGKIIVNLTPNTALNIFEKGDIKNWI
jgi:hypothetical protein